MKKLSGVGWVLMIIVMLARIALFVTVAYAIWHFVEKYW